LLIEVDNGRLCKIDDSSEITFNYAELIASDVSSNFILVDGRVKVSFNN
jgi:hypothetical protein